MRKDLVWCGMGFVLVQLALAVGLEACWPALRDPDFDELERVVRKRQAAAPGRPLVFVLGSSRTQQALRAERLNNPSDATATPVVINCAMSGGGPMLHQVVLRRLLRAGFRPHLVFVESMPLALSARDGPPIEERQNLTGRYTAAELAHLYHYFARPYRLWFPWSYARLLPCYRHQAELRHALGIDLTEGATRNLSGRDDYGWVVCPKLFSPQEVASKTQASLEQYATALTQAAVAPGALQALRDVVNLCRDEHIPVVFFAPAEGSRFRSFAPAVAESQMNAVRGLARELGVPLIDARTWIDDEGFYDGHHANWKGAEQYTEHFCREAFLPQVSRQPSWTAGLFANGVTARSTSAH